jgi:alpha-glucosidase
MMLGPDLLVVPVLEPQQRKQRVFLPEDAWIHLWSGQTYSPKGRGDWVEVDAPLGMPPVFLRSKSTFRDGLLKKLQENKALRHGPSEAQELPLV